MLQKVLLLQSYYIIDIVPNIFIIDVLTSLIITF